MQIDWFTLAAEIVNFLLLIVLLRLLLYKRIVRAMNEREQRIASDLNDAEEKRKEAEREAESYREKRRELETRQKSLISEAEENAEERRKELMSRAREEVEESRDQWFASMRRERDSFLSELRRRAGRKVIGIARRVLSDLADSELEDRIVRIFIRRLRDLDEEEKRQLGEMKPEDGWTVAGSWSVSEDLRDELEEAVREVVGDSPRITFETKEELVAGLELRSGGRRLAWSVDSYLNALEEELADMVDQRAADNETATEQEQS